MWEHVINRDNVGTRYKQREECGNTLQTERRMWEHVTNREENVGTRYKQRGECGNTL